MKTLGWIIFLALSLGSGLWLGGSFLHWVGVLGFFANAVLPVVFVLLAWATVLRWRKQPLHRGILGTTSVVVIVSVGLLVSLLSGKIVHDWRISQVRSYVDQVVPMLEAYRGEYDRYPMALSSVSAPPVPDLLKGSYHASGQRFSFHYRDPSRLMGGSRFDSGRREWVNFD